MECFNLDAAGSNDNYNDASNDYNDAGNDNSNNNDLSERHLTRAQGKPGKTTCKTKVNHPRVSKPTNKGPPDIVCFFGDRDTRGTPPVTC
jgi:hypothetical protein